MFRPRRRHIVIAVTFITVSTGLVLLDLRGVSPADDPDAGVAFSGPAMGSTWLVRLTHRPARVSPDAVQDQVQRVLDRIEGEMSTWKADSELSRFNRARTTEWTAVSPETAEVVAAAQEASAESDGAFDVTVGPLVNLWGFGPDPPSGPTGTIPADGALSEARKHVGYHLLKVRREPPALRKSDPLVYVDLSGIAKGYAADQVGRLLDDLGIRDCLVAVGGETRARGVSEAGRPWRIGIENPTPGTHRVLYSVALPDLSLSTSGDYRNFFDRDGRRYCHEIDPATGRPVANAAASVSIVNASGTRADALATALMVLGPEKGLALARQQHIAVLFILRGDGKFATTSTPEFEKLLVHPQTQP